MYLDVSQREDTTPSTQKTVFNLIRLRREIISKGNAFKRLDLLPKYSWLRIISILMTTEKSRFEKEIVMTLSYLSYLGVF